MKRLVAMAAALLISTNAFADSLGSAAGGTAGNQSNMAGAVYRATPPTLTDGQQVGLQVDSSGNLKTNATVVSSGTQNTNLIQVNGAAVNVGTGAAGTGTQRVTTSTDSQTSVNGADGATKASSTNLFPVGTDGVTDGATGASNAVGSATNFTFTGTQAPFTATPTTNFSSAGFQALIVQIIGNVSSNSVTTEGSNDGGTTWTALSSGNTAGLGNTQISTSFNAGAGISVTYSQLPALIRLRVSTFIGGTTTLAIVLKKSLQALPNSYMQTVVGSVASAAADSGNPVKTGGKYNSTPIALTNGQRGDTQLTPTGATLVEEGGRTYSHLSTAATTTVKSGAGYLHTITVNSLGTVASTATIYDNTAGSGTVIAVLNTLTVGQGSYTYDIAFAIGLTIVTTGTVAPDITVSYR